MVHVIVMGLLVTAALSAGCSAETITGPSDPGGGTTGGSSTTVTPALTHVIRGIVIDENHQPVIGANVQLGVSNVRASPTVTDSSGAFDLTVESPPSRIPDIAEPVLVDKTGYEPSVGFVNGSCCLRVRLYRIRHITAGESVELPLFTERIAAAPDTTSYAVGSGCERRQRAS